MPNKAEYAVILNRQLLISDDKAIFVVILIGGHPESLTAYYSASPSTNPLRSCYSVERTTGLIHKVRIALWDSPVSLQVVPPH